MAGNIYYINVFGDNAVQNAYFFQIWNPSATRTIALLEVSAYGTTGANPSGRPRFRRSTARGTPNSSIVPTAEHHARREAAPDSGFEVDVDQASPPTLAADQVVSYFWTNSMIPWNVYSVIPGGIEIPPGTGLCLVWENSAGAAPAMNHISLTIEEL